MEEKQHRRTLTREYRERTVTGGVYTITNRETGKTLLLSGLDLVGCRNRFMFSVTTGSCIHPRLQSDWKQYSGKAFEFEALEELKKADAQSLQEFQADLGVLLELWREKLAERDFY